MNTHKSCIQSELALEILKRKGGGKRERGGNFFKLIVFFLLLELSPRSHLFQGSCEILELCAVLDDLAYCILCARAQCGDQEKGSEGSQQKGVELLHCAGRGAEDGRRRWASFWWLLSGLDPLVTP